MNTGNSVWPGPKTCSLLQTPGNVGFQAVQDDKTTQTKPLGHHQPDIGMSFLTGCWVMGNAVLGHTNMSLNVPIGTRAGKWGPDSMSLGTQLRGEGTQCEGARSIS